MLKMVLGHWIGYLRNGHINPSLYLFFMQLTWGEIIMLIHHVSTCVFQSSVHLFFFYYLAGFYASKFMSTLFSVAVGKLPRSSVSDEKLEYLRKSEQEKCEKTLSNYIAFCGKVCVCPSGRV